MATYAVGDIQGCYAELMDVLEQVAFNPAKDQLWVVGDFVNRGNKCKATLRYLYENRKSVRAVLGNHDLHLLAIQHGVRKPKRSDTFDKILAAPQCEEWLGWLQTLPLCWHDEKLGYTMAHAGIAPQWSLDQALALSAEVEKVLQGKRASEFFEHMYGDEPNLWQDDLSGYARLRCITNYFTRMRLVDARGALNLGYKNDLNNVPDGYYPWFLHPERNNSELRIIFGHWAALGGYINNHNLFGLDSGCVWGRSLTLMQLDTHDLFIAQAQA
ncbi:MAG: symmetrical bis(5'-nucleosyl)-tetraphosphatase [Gammaproteobacteria bacterium]|nr:symmetrical bis(5'-nucleosyl)-tetraphosphatase [Gammaproteobacteria bacterium]NND38239.1 symmetrical bis(5'-nucleosyl)-tetraphosphatase [Pseudomonadales bacterium]MBT8150338.1 symmetrical bis(5'-nucleosyl)-tetraphosphatase [Gammaproteobacteria bacterium]NNL11313.1 symmetrical bis(5'-nucleosyl)-tetraphosphatase [Pseudomonadales bacterium]NNM12029.1 symmetrical bis(5'-nucleosyl)-tetraphosphatase [Pseudomonadales bacterium]